MIDAALWIDRALVAGFVGFLVATFARVLQDELRRRARDRRRAQFVAWVKRARSPEELTLDARYFRAMLGDPSFDYRGPWEKS